MLIMVKNGNVGQAYKILMKGLTKDGLFRELREREAYTPPAKKRLRKHKIAVSRIKKDQKKKAEAFENLESRLPYRTKYKNK